MLVALKKGTFFKKRGMYYLLLWRWSYNNNGKSLTLYSVLLVINIRNVMFTKIPQVLHNRWITQGLSLPFWEFCIFSPFVRMLLASFHPSFEHLSRVLYIIQFSVQVCNLFLTFKKLFLSINLSKESTNCRELG